MYPIPQKRLTILCGHYGSGKTNIAVNLAVALRATQDTVTVADLDIVNPYFRSKDSAELLEAAGRKRGFLMARAEVNTERMAKVLLDEYRGGKLGKFTLEMPPKEEVENG